MKNNDLINEDFYSVLLENYFFHDYHVNKINFSLIGNKFRLILSDDNDKIFSIIIKRIFSFTYNIDFLVEEKYYDTISWNNIFNFLRYRHLLNIDIRGSKYNDLSVKYLNKKALRITIDFDCGFNLEIDCIDVIISNIRKNQEA